MDINKICPGCMKEIEDIATTKFCPVCGYNLQEDTTAPHQLRPKSILNGKYIVGRVIGEGGFGITYLGFDLNLEIPVAIKEYYPNGFVTRDSLVTSVVSAYAGKNMEEFNKWRENFLKEARSLAKFSNLSGIVEVRDYFQENNTTYIVMEYVDGITMKEFLKSQGGKLPTETVLTYMQPIIKSLGKVHATGIIHRDISPDNIMMEKSGEMKLLDFGAARDISSNAEKSLSVLLKPGYAPEEQYRTRGNQGTWSDVYAICATIYKCITGVTPVESMERLRNDTLKMPSELGIGIHPNEEAALRKGLAVYAEDRFQTMEDLYAALYAGAPVTMPVPPAMPQGTTEPATGPFTGTHTATQTGAMTQGQTTGATPNVTGNYQGAQTGGTQSMGAAPQGQNKNMMLLIGAAAGVACIVVVFVVLALQGGNKTDMAQADNAVVAETTAAETVETTQELSEDDLAELADLEAQFNAAENMDQTQEAMNQICSFAENHGVTDTLKNKILTDYDIYCEALLKYVQGINNQAVSAPICQEMNLKFSNAIDTSDRLNAAGATVDTEKIKTIRDDSNEDYVNRWINTIDQEASVEMSSNGVVSRSTLWPMMEGADECGLFDVEDYHDPLRQRYIAALTLHADSEIEQLGSPEEKIAKIEEYLERTDYSPYLVYLLMVNGDYRGYDWYEQIRPTLNSIGGDFDYLTPQERLNVVYNYNANDDFVGARDKIRQILLTAKDQY